VNARHGEPRCLPGYADVATEDDASKLLDCDAISTPKEALEAVTGGLCNSHALVECQGEVAGRLRNHGWDTHVLTDDNARGVVSAEYREKKVMILCTTASMPVGDEALYRIYAYCREQIADYSAIVSNAPYSASVCRLALGTRTLLLQFDQLHLLQELIFGTTALEPQRLFRAEAE
jgi:hypothetical protein